ncbi:MAG: DbpA RNA binding domain-containing protein, partial [Spirochaetota bacterium]
IVSAPARFIDHLRRMDVDLSGVAVVAVDVPASGSIEQFSADLHFIYTKLERRPVTVAITRDLGVEFDLLEDLLRRPTTVPDQSWATPEPRLRTPSHEERTMSDLPFDPARMKEKIRDIVQSIHHDEDPIELNKYRAYARKYTTVFNRGYVLAYLLKQYIEGGGGGRSRRRQGKAPEGKPAEAAPAENGRQSIFVSIGRSKRVRSRDLITFFTSADAVNEDDIGQVKVLDNYSFVEVNADKAQAAIDALNGQELRGRKLTVNYARRK